MTTPASLHDPHIICCCLGVLLGSAAVSLPRSSGNIPLKTEIAFPNLLVSVLLVYRLTPKFASHSCKGKYEFIT